MAINWESEPKERDCPKCGTETEVNEDRDNRTKRECPSCNWWLYAEGRWKSPGGDFTFT